ncbi:MAG TPA: hypothetical protein VEJ68_00010 [Candidatus Bathyarchaeia archaeon]|nr:hypothetical protein [Candidatus Bathyarchaeia archaeon]
MSDEILRTVKNMLASGKGDVKRLREIMDTIKEGEPVLMSDYKYVESLTSQEAESQLKEKSDVSRPQTRYVRDESLEILRIRLAEGHITIDEFRELKKALTDE